jgi:hypothetical protein
VYRSERSAGGAYRGLVLTGLGLLTGLAVLAIGVGLLRRVDGALGVVGASLFLVCGMVVVGSAVVVLVPAWWRRFPRAREVVLDGESADFHPRRTGVPTAWAFCTLVLLGGWCAALGVVGLVEDGLAWPVIAAAPTIYFLGFVVLRVLGRFRAAGTWLTPTRLVDEYYGLRSEIATADLLAMRATPEALWVVPGADMTVRHRWLTPKPWRRKAPPAGFLVIDTAHLAGGSEALADALLRYCDVPYEREARGPGAAGA